MEGEREHFGVRQILKLFGAGVGLLIVLVVAMWFFGIYLQTTCRYYDIHSGRERTETKWLFLTSRDEIIDTEFSLNAQRLGLVTQSPQWRIFSKRTFPDEGRRRCYFTSIGELRSLLRSFELANTPEAQRDAIVRAVFVELSAGRDFRIDYDKDMNVVGVKRIGA